jgi:prolyl-tRNA synthetase
VKSVEVGNIFTLSTRFSEALDLSFTDELGEKKKVFMGSYGIGPARVMGTIVETLSDEKGIVWPKSVAPFAVHLIHLSGSDECKMRAEEVYKKLTDSGVEVLFDDRDARAGEKFSDSDLIGIPFRVVVSDKNTKEGDSYFLEVKDRKTGEVSHVSLDDLLNIL